MNIRIWIRATSEVIVKQSDHSYDHILHSYIHRGDFSTAARTPCVSAKSLTCQKIAEGSHELNHSWVHVFLRIHVAWLSSFVVLTTCTHHSICMISMTRWHWEYHKKPFDAYPRSQYHHNSFWWESCSKVNDFNDNMMDIRCHIRINETYNLVYIFEHLFYNTQIVYSFVK